MGSMDDTAWRRLDVAVIGGGIGGLASAIALRRAGHQVTIYEKADFAGEVGASVSCAANGTRWLHEWGVNVAKGDPVVLKKLINRDWTSGEIISEYDLADYEERWGHVYNMFHRQYMHAMLKDTALQEEGEGTAVKLLVNHQCKAIDLSTNTITFANSDTTARHDLIIGADGIGSATRRIIGIQPDKAPAEQSCLHANVSAATARRLGLPDYGRDQALEYWGGRDGTWDKIVLSPCNGGALLSYYCFFPRHRGDFAAQSWAATADLPTEDLLAPYPSLDRKVWGHLAIGKEIRPWRLWLHQPYPYLSKANICLLGDAGHPMMPHQSQGACMALEDAAALGILFSKRYFQGSSIRQMLHIYDSIRLPRVTKVQAAAARAAHNISERIGFSSNTSDKDYKVADAMGTLTIEEMNAYDMYMDIEEKLAAQRGETFTKNFTCGLPIGLKLSTGFVVEKVEQA